MLYSGLDLNCAADICHPARNSFAGGIDGHGQAGFRADHGASATDDVSSLRSALRGRTQSQNVFLPRSVSLHGIRAAYRAGFAKQVHESADRVLERNEAPRLKYRPGKMSA